LRAKFIPLNFFLISFFIHGLLFSLVIFTFTEQSISVKPSFVFLGSILQKEDFTERTYKSSQNSKEIESLNQDKTSQKFRKRLQRSKTIQKPSFFQEIHKYDKSNLKSTFYKKDAVLPTTKIPEKILGIDVKAPKRMPLRLNQK